MIKLITTWSSQNSTNANEMSQVYCSRGTVVFGTAKLHGLVVQSTNVSLKPLIETTFTNDQGRVVRFETDDELKEIKLEAIFLGCILPSTGDTFIYAFNQTSNKYILTSIDNVRSNNDVMRVTLTGRIYEYIPEL